MKKQMQISIPTPCHENWDAMIPEAKGRFCVSCQKTVLDFTNSSDREIASLLKNTENACGRFRTTQLDRDLVIPKEKSSFRMAASAAVVSFLTIGSHTVCAQTPVNTEQHVLETDEIIGDTTEVIKRNIITGVVCEKTQGPIPSVNIINLDTHKGTQTDIDGKFTIEAKTGDKLFISFVGITSKEVIVNSDINFDIYIEMEYMGIILEPKRTLFGRIFHSIGSIFR